MIPISKARRACSACVRALATAAVVAVATGAAASGTARADRPTCDPKNDAPFALSARALKGPTRTDVYATVTSTADECPVPDVFEKVQVKALTADGSTAALTNYFDVASPRGVATVVVSDLLRHQRLEVTALVQTSEAVRTVVLNAETTLQLRPDLTVKLSGPSRVVRKQPFAYEAAISEIAGDTAATALVSLYDGIQSIGETRVSVPADGTTTVSFPSLQIARAGTHTLLAQITDAAPTEYDATNDAVMRPLAVAMYDADGAVVSENAQATEIGARILREGGNAFDAAAAVQWALNFAEPENTGLGGGINALVHLANGDEWAIDGRETAPTAVDANYYGSKKNYSRNGFSVGVPGTLRTIDYMLEHWGTMTLAQTLEPAIKLGEDGVVVSKQFATSCKNRGWMDRDTKAICYPNGDQLDEGDTYWNPDLVKTFRLIAAGGPSVFYEGEIASAIVAAQQKSYDPGMGGVMTTDDLKSFHADVTKPISIDYRGYQVETAGPSTAGGIVLLEMLGMTERFPLGSAPDWGFQSSNATQVMLEAMRLGIRDRQVWIGDNRSGYYTEMPLAGLLCPDYLAERSQLIDPHKRIAPTYAGDPRGFCTGQAVGSNAGAAWEPEPMPETPDTGGHTSHFTIVDRWGNIVTATTTLGDGLGCTITVPGYGFLLNDASGRNFDDNKTPLAGKPVTVQQHGKLVTIPNPGANDAVGGKRGMGNVAPVLVRKDGEPVLITGGAGGAQIYPAVYQVITNVVDFHKTLQGALEAPRVGGDLTTVLWNCAADAVEPWFAGAAQFPQYTLDALRAISDPVRLTCEPYPWVGGTQSVAVDPETFSLSAAADPRGLPADGPPIIVEAQ
jgi:gamma-glutamyltranspeptidase/glutathione hydrolase